MDMDEETLVEEVAAEKVVIDFDGPEDPEKAVNWTPTRKWINVFILAAMTFIS